MLAKDTLEEFTLECELRRLTPRTIKLLDSGKTYRQVDAMTGMSKSTLIRARK